MGWTKRSIIEDAFGELALAGYDFDLSPEEFQAGERRLDTMMAAWLGAGIRLPYVYSMTADGSDLDDDSGLPLVVIEGVILNLAIRIAASKGKALAASTKASAKAAYDALLSRAAHSELGSVQPSGLMPRGAGARGLRPYLTTPVEDPLGTDNGLTFTGN